MLDNRSLGQVGQAVVKGGNPNLGAQTEAQTIRHQPDQPFTPALAGALKLPNRQRVEELVGDKVKRPLGQVSHRVEPCGVMAVQGLRLPRAQTG